LAMLFRHPDLSRYAAWGVPLYPAEVRGREALQSFWNGLARLTKPPVLRQPSPPLPPRVETAAVPPSPETTLLLFGGKGGVGKTTLACATAVWLANENTTRRILLFSTDPAHSLSDCLNLPVGPEPTVVHSGLAAVEIDPEAEFLVLKQEYAADLEHFLEALASNLDLVFDRQVMEKILDLAPPGLDEIMALSKVLELLAHRSYDVFVLDSASTGHLIRLLELPELIDQWLKVFFAVLLKYRRIFRLPKFSQRLVELSRNLKRLKKLLSDPACSHLCVVTIPTEMAFEETQDLLAACRRIGIGAPSIFLNLVTPPSDCGFCSTIRRREALVRTRFEKAFPDRAQAVIYRQGELRGVAQLEQLAQAMYIPARKEWPTYA
jgi:arsenite-transporting ATPase